MFGPRLPLNGVVAATPAVLAEILDGGQSFRWARQEDYWQGVFGRTVVRIFPGASGVPEFSCLRGADSASVHSELRRYLDGNGDPLVAADVLPWRSDPVLARAMAGFPGLRILRQPFPDTLIGFICSANANIPRIKSMVGSLASNLGEELAPGLHALPDWGRLASATDAELAPCKLGYRAAFLRSAAGRLAADPGFECRVAALPPRAAREALMSLPGVGPKVADCVRLFGLGRLDAFPVDTWIRKMMDAGYGLGGWSDAQVVHFAGLHFGANSGLAQQFLFAHARAGKAV